MSLWPLPFLTRGARHDLAWLAWLVQEWSTAAACVQQEARYALRGVVWAAGTNVVYTYDVYWELTDISWASRWDAYLRMPGGRVHWFSILNSLMVVVVMSSIVAMIMLRTIRRDLARYEGILGESGGAHQPACGCLCIFPLEDNQGTDLTLHSFTCQLSDQQQAFSANWDDPTPLLLWEV